VKPIRLRHTYTVGLAPEALWGRMGDVDEFQRWWPWLQRFSGGPPATGSTWECTVRPPVPYRVRFVVHLDEVVAERRIRATVSGDVAGSARVELAPAPAGTELTLWSALEPHSRLLRAMGTLAPRLARRGHDWVLTRAALDFPEPVVATDLT
jgi:Polyketide cyclase / dehydrase and lipid transport